MGRTMHIVILLTLSYISWSRQEEPDDILSTTSTPSNEDQERLANTINEFGYKLTIKMMKQNVNNNIVISPTGIAGLLAMTLLGSVGSTYDELAATLGFSQDILTNRKNHEQLGELLQALNTDTSSRTLYADAIFVDAHTQVRQVYRDYLQRVYRGDALAAHFGDRAKTKELINDWIKNHTNGKIEDFLKEPLTGDTKVVLINALYFSGQWAHPFLPDFTRKMPFVKPTGEEVMADMMFNGGQFRYTHNLEYGVHMIALPYNDSAATMYVLKPRLTKELNLTDLMDRLDNTKINKLIDEMTKQASVIRFPKMELRSEVDLEESLKELGIKSIFNPVDANFALMIDGNNVVNRTEEELITRINQGDEETRGLKDALDSLPNPGVHVDTVLHDVKITINEYGTEAAAATSVTLARTVQQFHADSPFYMFIRNENTKLITFSAIINDPIG